MTKTIALAAALTLAAGSAFAADFTVGQAGKQFKPEELTVKAGDSIVFSNDDTVVHNVYARGTVNDFDLGSQKPGATAKQSFDKAGIMDVRCAIHPKMKLKLTVE